jgi:dTDP-4-amino-4,6-dideoxygalactose transaminase
LDVPYVSLASLHARIKQEILDAVARVLDRADFILGEEVAAFEARFARSVGTRYAVAVHSGTDALELSLLALGLRDGDEVITAPNSFVTTASAIILAGGAPVFADVGPDYNIDPERVAAAITSRTRAILPVHLTGRPADMDAIVSLAVSRGLVVVEDAAQAVFARYRDKSVGALGHVGCFSLHPLKTLGACGDGGVITTDDEDLVTMVRAMRNNGQRTRDEASYWRGNSRLDTLQAAILLVKLDHALAWTEQRRRNATFYQEALSGLPGIDVPMDREWEYAVYHTFVIQADRRDRLRAYLSERGVRTAVHYPVPIHLQPVAAPLGYRLGDFQMAEEQSTKILSLPVHPDLTVDQLQHVANCIKEFVGGGG